MSPYVNTLCQKAIPLMTEAEVHQLVMDHYRGESQNLTSAAEANLLKLKELLGTLTEPETIRWTQIKKDFNRHKLIGGAGESDPVARVVAQMTRFTDGLDAIRQVGSDYAQPQALAETTVERLTKIIEGLRAVPVQVDIKVVPIQDTAHSIQNISPSAPPPLDIIPEITQGDEEPTGTPHPDD
jgi:hypothetical protein